MMEILSQGCEKLGIQLTKKQEQQFQKYYQLLLEWNQSVNLTSIISYEDVMNKHFLDSLCIVQMKDIFNSMPKKIIDVGTGAGFPGIPLKIVFPDMKLTLLDSLKKRIKFLDFLKDELGLEEIKTVHGRAEDLGKDKEYREQFNLCVSRAVANLAVLSEYCIPLVCAKGDFVAYKSGNIKEELEASRKAIDLLGGQVKKEMHFTIPNADMERSLIRIQKIRRTPSKYPRKSGTPGKLPLGH